MKIIAKTESGWLMDATNDEIATLQGFSRVDKRFKFPEPGQEFSITDTYDILANLSYDRDIKDIAYAHESLGKLHDWLKNYKSKFKEKSKVLQFESR